MATRKPKVDPIFRYSPLTVREYDVYDSMFFDTRKMRGEEVPAKWNLCWLSYPHEVNKYNTINREEKYSASYLTDFILCIHAYAGHLLMSSMQLPPLEAVEEILKVGKVPEVRDSFFYTYYRDKWEETMRERAANNCRPHPLEASEVDADVSNLLASICKTEN